MKRLTVLVALLLMASSYLGCEVINPMPSTQGTRMTASLRSMPRPALADRKKVTVYQFTMESSGRWGSGFTKTFTDQFIQALMDSGHFRVMERQNLNQIAAEKNLIRSGEAEGRAGADKIKGADYIFMGKITQLEQTSGSALSLSRSLGAIGGKQYSAKCALYIRIVDAGTSETLDAVRVSKSVRKLGMSGSARWGVSGSHEMSNALEEAMMESIEAGVLELVQRYGVQPQAAAPAPAP